MSEWWTYRPSDFLMFAPRTYYRLFELHNEMVWPLHVVALTLGAALIWLMWRGGRRSLCLAAAILAAAWLFVAWSYHWQGYATINRAAEYYAAGFVLQGLLLIAFAAVGGKLHVERPLQARSTLGLLLLAAGVVLYPFIAPSAARPWIQSELFGIAPDPTAIATLGAVLLSPRRAVWLLLPLPLLWCAVSAATLWTMGSPEAFVPAVAAALAALAWRLPRPGEKAQCSA
jgi:hypothetical protein